MTLTLASLGVASAVDAPPDGGPALAPLRQAQELSISANNLAFSTGTLAATADGSVNVHFTNNESGIPHSFSVYTDSSASQPLAPGSVGAICTGPCSNDVTFALPAPGSYFFRCDVHPTEMTGQFIVQAVAQEPAPTEPPAAEGPAAGTTAAPEATSATPAAPSGTQIARVPVSGSGPGRDAGLAWWPALLVLPAAALVAAAWLARRRAKPS